MNSYECDYGHNHLTAEAKRRCEERNDNRGVPTSARLAKETPVPRPAPLPNADNPFGKWRA